MVAYGGLKAGAGAESPAVEIHRNKGFLTPCAAWQETLSYGYNYPVLLLFRGSRCVPPFPYAYIRECVAQSDATTISLTRATNNAVAATMEIGGYKSGPILITIS